MAMIVQLTAGTSIAENPLSGRRRRRRSRPTRRKVLKAAKMFFYRFIQKSLSDVKTNTPCVIICCALMCDLSKHAFRVGLKQ